MELKMLCIEKVEHEEGLWSKLLLQAWMVPSLKKNRYFINIFHVLFCRRKKK